MRIVALVIESVTGFRMRPITLPLRSVMTKITASTFDGSTGTANQAVAS